jgi:hypothetical protein
MWVKAEKFKGFKRFKSSKKFKRFKECSIPINYIVSLKPNFYTELCCELSEDAAREDACQAIEPKHAAKVRQR